MTMLVGSEWSILDKEDGIATHRVQVPFVDYEALNGSSGKERRLNWL